MKKLIFCLCLFACEEEQNYYPKFCNDYVKLAQDAKKVWEETQDPMDEQIYLNYQDSVIRSCRGVIGWGTKR